MTNYKTILAIESSCDETAAAILEQVDGSIKLLSSVVASSLQLQAKFGGVIPEQAAREQLKSIIPVISEALEIADKKIDQIDAIAVTQGPGLIGSLLVGVETAKTLATIWQKPLIPINHLIGHFYANWIEQSSAVSPQITVNTKLVAENRELKAESYSVPTFPAVGLLVSGGHTDLVYFKSASDYQYLGGTRDDAAGECFDKSARLLGLPYPGGPEIAKRAILGNPKHFNLPVPMLHSGDYDFSFSGLKTAVANLVKTVDLDDQTVNDIAATLQDTISAVLVKKAIQAVKDKQASCLMVAGGVAANQYLAAELQYQANRDHIPFYIPPAQYCTDNAAMIGAAAFFHPPVSSIFDVEANPNLGF